MQKPQWWLPNCTSSLGLCYNESYFIPFYYKYAQSEISGKHHRVLLKKKQYLWGYLKYNNRCAIIMFSPANTTCGKMSL